MEKDIADYYEALIANTNNYKAAANWLNGPVKQYLNENKLFNDFSLQPEQLAGLLKLVEDGKVNFSVASTRILPVLIAAKNNNALQFATELNLSAGK